jgi:hypothetical protein
VLDGEFKHVLNLLGATDRATPDADGFGDQGEGRDSGEGLFALLQKRRTCLKTATYSPAQLKRKMSLAVGPDMPRTNEDQFAVVLEQREVEVGQGLVIVVAAQTSVKARESEETAAPGHDKQVKLVGVLLGRSRDVARRNAARAQCDALCKGRLTSCLSERPS